MRPDKRSGPRRESGAAGDRWTGDTQSISHSADSRPKAHRRLVVTLVNRQCAYVSGHGSRQLLTELRGRPPLWSSLSRAWATTDRTARDLIAVAESRGYEVTVEHGDPGGGRW